MNTYIQEKQDEFLRAVDFFKKEISSLRTGRANPIILENVQVEAYGVKSPLQGVASINVPDSQSLSVAPWDKSILKDIEKAIVEANLGLGVVNDGVQIRLTVPRMTEENRRDLVKRLNEKMEEARISFRRTRDEIKGSIEQAEKEKEISADDKFSYIKELDEEVSRQNAIIKDLRDEKEKDIMTI